MLTAEILTKIGTDKENISGIQSAVESILETWQTGTDKENSVTFTTGRRMEKGT